MSVETKCIEKREEKNAPWRILNTQVHAYYGIGLNHGLKNSLAHDDLGNQTRGLLVT